MKRSNADTGRRLSDSSHRCEPEHRPGVCALNLASRARSPVEIWFKEQNATHGANLPSRTDRACSADCRLAMSDVLRSALTSRSSHLTASATVWKSNFEPRRPVSDTRQIEVRPSGSRPELPTGLD